MATPNSVESFLMTRYAELAKINDGLLNISKEMSDQEPGRYGTNAGEYWRARIDANQSAIDSCQREIKNILDKLK